MRVTSVLIAAIGGQGGNVLAEWLFLAASLDEQKMKAQAIALPGLSQRGGGTTFYLEIAHQAKDQTELDRVVFSQHPFPGRVDIIIGQELVELGRVLRTGYAGNRTTVVGSTYRNYTIGEKMPSFDGIYPSEEIERMAHSLAGQVALLDVPALAEANKLGELAANAIMFGVLSALPSALPYSPQACENAIRNYGLAVDMNLKAFAVGRAYMLELAGVKSQSAGVKGQLAVTGNQQAEIKIPVLAGAGTTSHNNNAKNFEKNSNGTSQLGAWAEPTPPPAKKVIIPLQRKEAKPKPDLAKTIAERETVLESRQHKAFRHLVEQIQTEFAPELHLTLIEAVYQTLDYQNEAYAKRYLGLVKDICRLDNAQKQYRLAQIFAKKLAARMTYEDAVRVATQKIQPQRFERIRKDMGLKDGQLLQVTDYLKPDAAEIYGIMPYFLVAPMLFIAKICGMGKLLEKFYLEQKPKTNTFSGFLTFKFLTWFKPLRSISHRAHLEWQGINRYIRLVKDYSAKDYELACLAAETGKLIKGYGDTRRKMFEAVDVYLNNILTPLEKWEAQAKDQVGASESRYPVTVKAGKLALSLLVRDDNGKQRAETFANQVLATAKAKTSRNEILANLEAWARALR
jgi:indolepyruvate ferredoxin oxidoreductase beta subunit